MKKGKIPLSRRGCLSFITGAGLGGLSVPRNLGMGHKERPDRNILGRGSGHRES